MHIPSTRRAAALLATAAVLVLPPVWAASPASGAVLPVPMPASIEATYRQDRAACLSATSQHERSSCLREAGAVRDAARRGRSVPSEAPEARARHALQRCKDMSIDRQLICERMAQGEGSASGSVAGGGVLRELVTEMPATPVPNGAPAVAPGPAQ